MEAFVLAEIIFSFQKEVGLLLNNGRGTERNVSRDQDIFYGVIIFQSSKNY